MKKTILMRSLLALVLGACTHNARQQARPTLHPAEQTQKPGETRQPKAKPGALLKVERIFQVPEGIEHEGEFRAGVRYSDRLGTHIVILSEKGREHFEKDEEDEHKNLRAELFAERFVVEEDNTLEPAWRVYDSQEGCSMDVDLGFIPDAFQVTDLNQDGIAEIWLAYSTSCGVDLAPKQMTIIMHEGKQAFTMSGRERMLMVRHQDEETGEWLAPKPEDYWGGDYSFNKAFHEAPKAFQCFAKNLWNKYALGEDGDGCDVSEE